MKSSPLYVLMAFASALSSSLANILDPLNPKDGSATELSLKFQPALDFDKDSCYHVTALDLKGHFNEGLRPNHPVGASVCRTADRLAHSNAYVRRRCNHYWCAYMYGYYFEKDEGPFVSHIHDWEHVIIWTLHNEIFYVSWSAHGNYTTKHISDSALRFHEGTHIKIVYHIGSGPWSTHSLRLAKGSDEPPENHWGRWFVAWLVEVTWMEPWSKMLLQHNWGEKPHPDMREDDFGMKLKETAPWDAIHNEGFDPWSDADTWATTSLLSGMGLRSNFTSVEELVQQDL